MKDQRLSRSVVHEIAFVAVLLLSSSLWADTVLAQFPPPGSFTGMTVTSSCEPRLIGAPSLMLLAAAPGFDHPTVPVLKAPGPHFGEAERQRQQADGEWSHWVDIIVDQSGAGWHPGANAFIRTGLLI